ncbi:MAG TPA: hypothetical protein DCM71_22645 [Runella sp.]|nr:hypothetical protein [Runella sp.]
MLLSSQDKAERIQKAYSDAYESINKYETTSKEYFLGYLEDLHNAIITSKPLDIGLRETIQQQSYYTTNYLSTIFHFFSISEGVWECFIHSSIPENTFNGFRGNINRFINNYLFTKSDDENNLFLKFLYRQGFTDERIFTALIYSGSQIYFIDDKDGIELEDVNSATRSLSFSGKYILSLLEREIGILGISNNTNFALVLEQVLSKYFESSFRRSTLQFLNEYYPSIIYEKYENFITHKDYNGLLKLDLEGVFYLIKKQVPNFEEIILNSLQKSETKIEERLSIFLALSNIFPSKYTNEINELINVYFTTTCKIDKNEGNYRYVYEPYIRPFFGKKYETISVIAAKHLLSKNETFAIETLQKYIIHADFFHPVLLNFLSEYFKEGSLEFLVIALTKNPKYLQKNFHDVVFSLIEQYNFSSIAPKIWEYAIHNATKNTRNLAASTLAKLGDESFETAKNFLQAKTADTRIVAALVLSKLRTEDAERVLNAVLEVEKNDDTRDVILEALEETLFANPISLTQAKTIIQNASKRGKLSKFSEKWIDESQLPPIYWKNNQGTFSKEEVRFLFYRMPRGKGLNSDIELRQLLPLIDRNQSGGFAKALLKAFADSGSNSKFKYYLTTGGMLGGDEALTTLKGIFKYNMDEKRYKMAEYAIDAMMQVGTNKALRSIEVISRKYVSKRPTVSDRAIKALDAAALELNITTDELADRIIPNFEFEGLFKSFEVDGDEYRAFVNSDFTLCYFDEDNKMRKSLPKSASSDLKKEFKEIEKEIRDVIKTQSGRLEKYMIEERQWSIGQWQAAFLESPIMFVYAMKLLWGIFNKEKEFKEVFYCQEDTSLLNLDDEEIEFEEGDYISILHPIYLTQEQIKAWQSKIYELSILSVFSQLERKTFTPSTDELELNYTRIFQNQDIPKGADYASSTIEKYGWIKSTGDGGHLELIKKHQTALIQANAEIEGVYAWYQGGNAKATVNNISFRGKSWNDTLSLKDIPPVFFSEVLFDIYRLINAV